MFVAPPRRAYKFVRSPGVAKVAGSGLEQAHESGNVLPQ